MNTIKQLNKELAVIKDAVLEADKKARVALPMVPAITGVEVTYTEKKMVIRVKGFTDWSETQFVSYQNDLYKEMKEIEVLKNYGVSKDDTYIERCTNTSAFLFIQEYVIYNDRDEEEGK